MALKEQGWNTEAAQELKTTLLYSLTGLASSGLPIKLENFILPLNSDDRGEVISWIGNSNFLGSPSVQYPLKGKTVGVNPHWSQVLQGDERLKKLYQQAEELHKKSWTISAAMLDMNSPEFKALLLKDLWLHYEIANAVLGHLNEEFSWTVTGKELLFPAFAQNIPKLVALFPQEGGLTLGWLMSAARDTLVDNRLLINKDFGYDGIIRQLVF